MKADCMPGQHLRHPTFVNVANDSAISLTLDEHLSDQIVFENGRHAFRGHSKR